jgi:hypothetical protein
MKIKRTQRFHGILLTQAQLCAGGPYTVLVTSTVVCRGSLYSAGHKHSCVQGILIQCWWECKLIKPPWKAVWRCLKNLKLEPPYDPTILLLSVYPKEYKSGCNGHTCTLSTIHTSTAHMTFNWWVKRIWYVKTTVLFSHKEEWNYVISRKWI